MSRPKRHHYLPQFYLERFAQDGLHWIYDRSLNAFRCDRPKNTAVQSQYYSFIDEEGSNDPAVELSLADIEGKAKPVFDRIVAGEELITQDRFQLSLFMGFLACRTPSFERSVNEVATGFAEVILRRNLERPNAGTLFKHPPEEIARFLDSGRFGVKVDKNTRIGYMIDVGSDIGKSFFASNWTIARANDRTSFVTCDNPFGILFPESMGAAERSRPYGVASPEVITAFPLSARTCVLMLGTGAATTETLASSQEVRAINLAVIAETETYAIAREERHLRSLVDASRIATTPLRTKMVVEDHPDPSGDPTRSILVTRRLPTK